MSRRPPPAAWLVLLAGGAASAAAQTAPEAFAGRPVTAVELRLPPDEAAPLEQYLEIEIGAPLDLGGVRRSVEQIFATGRYADVVVEARAEAQGVALAIRPIPAPLFAELRVAGDRVLSKGELARAAGLARQEPLWPARLDAAARSVGVALREKGYLEGRATLAVEPHPRGAAAVVEVAAGPRAYVSRVALEGAPPEALALEARLRPRVGEPYEPERAQASLRELERELRGLGRWRATASLGESYDPRTARIGLVFQVVPGPRTSAGFEGLRLSAALTGELERRLRDGSLRGDVIDEVADRVLQELESRGHRSAEVSWTEESRPGQLRIVYAATPGPRSEVASVRVDGWPAGSAPPLLETTPGTPLREASLAADRTLLLRQLNEAGHLTPRVEPELPDGAGPLPVVFQVEPGPATRVAQAVIEGLPPEVVAPRLAVVAGAPLRLRDLARDRTALVAACRDAGHLQADASPELDYSEDRGEATVRYRIAAGERVRVAGIVVAGLRDTRETVVRRELQLAEGDPLGAAAVLESQRRLLATGLFERVAIRELDPEAASERRLIVELEEARRTTLAYGLGYSERDLLRASVEVTRRNLYGMDRTLTGFARVSFRSSRLLASYREPRVFGARQDLFLTAFREEEDREGFDFTRRGALVQTARDLVPRLSLILRYAFQATHTFNVEVPIEEIDREFLDSLVAGPAASLVYDSRDDPLDPRRGVFSGLDLQLSSHYLGGDDFVKGYLQGALFRPLAARLVLGASARLGLSGTYAGAPPQLPLPERFFAGGDHSLRGYPIDGVDTSGGNALALASLELRFDVARRFSLATFLDTGNTYPLVSDVDLGKLLYSTGLGLRYKSAFGPLRLDWGYKLNPRPEDEKRWQLHLTVGHAF